MQLTDVKDLGPSAADKLDAAGIESVEQLAEIDLRGNDVEGLSTDHLARLRNNARKLIEAQPSGELTLVDGLGPSARDKLNAAGVKTIDQLFELDLRSANVEGLSTKNLQKLKRNAAYLVPD